MYNNHYNKSMKRYGGDEQMDPYNNPDRLIDNIYVNVVMTGNEIIYKKQTVNFVTESNVGLIDGSYNVTKDDLILDKSSDYYCSVVRFSIPLNSVPLMIFPIVPNQVKLGISPNPNLSPWIIGIQLDTAYTSGNVQYIQDPGVTAPEQDQIKQVVTPYYYIYNYKRILNIINATLYNIYVASNLAAIFPGYKAPYFELDPTTNLISLIVPKFFTVITAPLVYLPKLYMNTALFKLLDNFLYVDYTPGASNGADIFFEFSNATGYPPFSTYYNPPGVTAPLTTTPPELPATPLYFKYTQDFPNISYWTSLRKIIITTNMPIKNEHLPSYDSKDPGSNNSYPILTDFLPNVADTAGSTRSLASYVPTSQYRLLDLTSNNALRNIDLKLFWQDLSGQLYPIQISNDQQASVKIGFFRKSLYNN